LTQGRGVGACETAPDRAFARLLPSAANELGNKPTMAANSSARVPGITHLTI
jgi:hypothetical protein